MPSQSPRESAALNANTACRRAVDKLMSGATERDDVAQKKVAKWSVAGGRTVCSVFVVCRRMMSFELFYGLAKRTWPVSQADNHRGRLMISDI
jgi:hypothetical protein